MPATVKQIDNVLASVRRGAGSTSDKLLDIGSGDGRIVIAAAKRLHLEAHGVELNPWLVYYSRLAALKGGVFGQTKFYRKDLWKFDISGYNNIVIFGVEQMVSSAKIRDEGTSFSYTRIHFLLLQGSMADDSRISKYSLIYGYYA